MSYRKQEMKSQVGGHRFNHSTRTSWINHQSYPVRGGRQDPDCTSWRGFRWFPRSKSGAGSWGYGVEIWNSRVFAIRRQSHPDHRKSSSRQWGQICSALCTTTRRWRGLSNQKACDCPTEVERPRPCWVPLSSLPSLSYANMPQQVFFGTLQRMRCLRGSSRKDQGVEWMYKGVTETTYLYNINKWIKNNIHKP